MKIFNDAGEVVVEFGEKNKVLIHPEWMRDDLMKLGISIPGILQREYQGFEEIYTPEIMIERSKEESLDITPQAFRDMFRQAVEDLYFPIKLEGKGFYCEEEAGRKA